MNPVKRGSGWEHLLEIARIEGLDRAFTWNPAVGCYGFGCEVKARGVCWAEKMAKRFGWSFEPHLIPERLDEPLRARKPAVITPVSMGDLFGLKREDFEKIYSVFWNAGWHKYAILTKLPMNTAKYYAAKYYWGLDNIWFGVTINSQKDVWRLEFLSDEIDAPRKYCLFEPLYGPIDFDLSWLDLIVVGPQNYPLVQPKREWVESVVRNAGNAKVFFKSNLKVG
jgi:protein gp37